MFSNLRILHKQLFGFFFVILIALVIGIFGFYGVSTLQSEMDLAFRTTPLIDAAMEMKLSVARDMQMIMELKASNSPQELEAIWQEHLSLAKAFDVYANAITKGAETKEGTIYATDDEKLKAIVVKADQFHNDQFLSQIKSIYDVMSQKVAGTLIEQSALDKMDKSVDLVGENMLDIIGGVEEGAKKRIHSTQASAAHTAQNIHLLIISAMAVGVGVSIVLAIVIAGLITTPIKRVVEHAEKMAAGDLRHQLNIAQRDEIGSLSQALNQMTTRFAKMIHDISGSGHTLTAAATELATVSGQMNQGSEKAAQRCRNAATAAEQMSSNMTSVASASEQLAANVQMVATAAEEMAATVSEIAQNSAKASSVTSAAVTKASSVTQKVDQLGTSAKEISKVTEVITEISEQTNLLALNATIEAARAGEAGKGFAVVANEIKELAKQTAQATAEIKAKINSIQTSTSATVSEIGEISKVIHDVNEIVDTIAASVEEQSVTTKDIVANISQAAKGIQDVNENINQGSQVSSDMAKDIGGVSQSTEEISTASAHVLSSSQELSTLAEQLNQMIKQFRTT